MFDAERTRVNGGWLDDSMDAPSRTSSSGRCPTRSGSGLDAIFHAQLRGGRAAPSYEHSPSTGVTLLLAGRQGEPAIRSHAGGGAAQRPGAWTSGPPAPQSPMDGENDHQCRRREDHPAVADRGPKVPVAPGRARVGRVPGQRQRSILSVVVRHLSSTRSRAAVCAPKGIRASATGSARASATGTWSPLCPVSICVQDHHVVATHPVRHRTDTEESVRMVPSLWMLRHRLAAPDSTG